MATRGFGKVVSAISEKDFVVRVESGEAPPMGAGVQLLTGALAARGAFATDEHNALIDARESVCAALRAQVQRPKTYERQQQMISLLQHIDQLLEAKDA